MLQKLHHAITHPTLFLTLFINTYGICAQKDHPSSMVACFGFQFMEKISEIGGHITHGTHTGYRYCQNLVDSESLLKDMFGYGDIANPIELKKTEDCLEARKAIAHNKKSSVSTQIRSNNEYLRHAINRDMAMRKLAIVWMLEKDDTDRLKRLNQAKHLSDVIKQENKTFETIFDLWIQQRAQECEREQLHQASNGRISTGYDSDIRNTSLKRKNSSNNGDSSTSLHNE